MKTPKKQKIIKVQLYKKEGGGATTIKPMPKKQEKKVVRENDPLEVLVKSKDWQDGYKSGYEAGSNDTEKEMQGDYDLGENYGFKRGTKFLKNVVKISNQWNIREISAETAIFKIYRYLRLKIK